MFRFYPIVLILEAFCIYHAYKNKADQKWYWIIIIFPLLGSLLYLYHHFYSRENVDTITEELKGVLNSNYSIKRLEKELDHCESATNRINLANEYLEVGRYKEAKKLYNLCTTLLNDPDILMKLVKANYLDNDFETTTQIGQKLKDNKKFDTSEEKIYLAWAYYKIGSVEVAEQTFMDMEDRYSNYAQRIEYCKFLGEINKKDEALVKLEELMAEWKEMNRIQKRQYRGLNTEIRTTYTKIND